MGVRLWLHQHSCRHEWTLGEESQIPSVCDEKGVWKWRVWRVDICHKCDFTRECIWHIAV